MPGAGAINAAKHLYAVARKDGTSSHRRPRHALAPLRGEKATRIRRHEILVIGSPASETMSASPTTPQR